MFKNFLYFIRTCGPGMIVMIADNDFGGGSTSLLYGYKYGVYIIITLLVALPILIINQIMCVKLGVISKSGHAELINTYFGRGWAILTTIDTVLLNSLTIISNFLGIVIIANILHIKSYLLLLFTSLLIFLFHISGEYKRWKIIMFVIIGINILYLPLLFRVHSVLFHNQIFNSYHQLNDQFNILLAILSIVGTTIAPWQLFFQQANIVDKKISVKDMKYEYIDTIVGGIIITFIGIVIVLIGIYIHTQDPFITHLTVANIIDILTEKVGKIYGYMLLILLYNAALIGISIITLSSSYVICEILKKKHSLTGNISNNTFFYTLIGIMIFITFLITLIPNLPSFILISLIQVISCISLPITSLFLVLLCNRKDILGDKINNKTINIITILSIMSIVVFSLFLILKEHIQKYTVVSIYISIAIIILSTILFSYIVIKDRKDNEDYKSKKLQYLFLVLRIYIITVIGISIYTFI